MRTGFLILTLLLPLPALAADVLIWQTTKDGYQTQWATVDGDAVTVIATREEAVASDGATLWALRLIKKTIPLYPCEMMEVDKPGTPEGSFDWPELSAVPLNGAEKPVSLMEGWGTDPFFGEVWSRSIRLLGSAGAYVFAENINTGFGCGAHGYDDSGLAVQGLGAAAATTDSFKVLPNEAMLGLGPTEALLEKAEAEDCVDDPDMSRDSIYLDGMALTASGGEVTPTVTWVHPTGADWQFACTLTHDHVVKTTDLAPTLQPTAAISRALKALKVVGTVGYSELKLSGEARSKALAAFKKGPAAAQKRTVAAPDARPFIASGRKLTQEKKYELAIKAFTQAIRKDAKAARAWSGRGYAKLLAGKLDSAARDLDHALTLDATDDYHAAIWFNLGKVAEKQKKLKQARRAYRRSNKLKASKAVDKALQAVEKALKQ